MHPPTGPRTSLAQCFQKAPPIRVVLKDGFPPVPAIENVINRPGKFHARFTSHDKNDPLRIQHSTQR